YHKKNVPIQPKQMFVERVVIEVALPPGKTEIQLDNLALSPLVRFQAGRTESHSGPIKQASQSAVETKSTRESVNFRLHRLSVGNKPCLVRMVPFHGEHPDVLAAAGMNVAWRQEYENSNLTSSLRERGIWTTAAPPYAKGIDGEPLDSE